MSTLRQAYNDKKQLKDKIITEASLNWIKENVVIINEKLDRSTVTRLINHVKKFEDTFGEYKEKLPTIANYLNSAEEGLRLVITGQSTEKRTSNMLEQLSYLYSMFSDFFTRDLPVLMKTNLFNSAKENPDTPLLQLRYQSNSNMETDTIKNAFINAILPSKEEKKLLSRIYRATTLPIIDANAVANELIRLSYGDLEQLTKIGKVPLVSTDTELETTNENKNLISEETLLTEVDISEIQPSLNAIKQVINNVDALEALRDPINNLQSKVLDVLAGGDIKSYLGQAAQSDNPVDFLKNLFTTPKGKILAQANMAVETIKNVTQAWNKIQPLLEKEKLTKSDVSNIKKIITNAATGGSVSRLTSLFKTQPFPGLSPQDISNALTEPLEEYLQTAGFFGESNNFINEQDIPDEATDAIQRFKANMEQLVSAMKMKGSTKPTTSTSSTTSTTPTEKTTQTTETTPAVKSTDEPGYKLGDINLSKDDQATTAKSLAAAFKGKLKPEQVNQLTSILVQQGYKISKR